MINYDAIFNLPAIQEYEKIRLENIKVNYEQYLFIDGSPRKTKEQVVRHIEKHKSAILDAARSQDIDQTSNSHLYKYLKEPVHSANLSAAKIRYDINHWEPAFDISDRPDILGTTYSQRDKDIHNNPKSNDRGKQIANEFYPLIQELFSK